MLAILDEIRFGKSFLALVKDPTNTKEVFKMSEAARRLNHEKPAEVITDFALGHPDFARLYEDRYLPSLPDLESLARLPDGTLGKEYSLHMARNHLKPDFFPPIDPGDPLGYLVLRVRQSHDIWHVLAGYDSSVRGELALQGFTLAQTRSGLSSALLAGGLLHVSKTKPDQVTDAMDKIVEGYLRGKRAKYLLGVPWESLWDTSLTEARRLAQIDVS